MLSYRKKPTQFEKIERLKFALNNQIEWQKHAEGKNLLFLTLTAGTLVFIYGDVDAYNEENLNFLNKLSWFYTFFIFTSLTSFFIAFLSLGLMFYKTIFPGRVSLISWDYVRRRSKKELKKSLDGYNDAHHIDDLIVQHLYGSKLTYRKYFYFSFGMAIFSLGIMSLMIEFLIRLLK